MLMRRARVLILQLLVVHAAAEADTCCARVDALELETAALRMQHVKLAERVDELVERLQEMSQSMASLQVGVNPGGGEMQGQGGGKALPEVEETPDHPAGTVANAGGTVRVEKPLPGGRSLSQSSSGTCCRWVQDAPCSGQSDDRLDKCTSLHEYLEHKTTTHEFADVDSCLGADNSMWKWRYDSTGSASVVLSNGGTVAATVPTPLKVTHEAGCAQSSVSLQLPTTVGQLSVTQRLVVNETDVMAVIATNSDSISSMSGSWQDGITTSGVSGSNLQYLQQNGLVYLRGSFSGSFSDGKVIGSLPASARPTENIRLMLGTNANSYPYATVQFKTDGDIKVRVLGGNSASQIWIDGVVFHKP